MTVTAATSLAAGTNQRPPRADLAPSPCCARGLHSVRAHHTEPRKTCSRVRGICNSAIMKREFLQPCARQNSEFTHASTAGAKLRTALNGDFKVGTKTGRIAIPLPKFFSNYQRRTKKESIYRLVSYHTSTGHVKTLLEGKASIT